MDRPSNLRPDLVPLADFLAQVALRRLQARTQDVTLAEKLPNEDTDDHHSRRTVRPIFDRPTKPK